MKYFVNSRSHSDIDIRIILIAQVLIAALLFTQGWTFITIPAALGLVAVLASEWLTQGDADTLDLTGKNVWITGAGSGIGEALVRVAPHIRAQAILDECMCVEADQEHALACTLYASAGELGAWQAKECCARGARVVLSGRRVSELERVRRECMAEVGAGGGRRLEPVVLRLDLRWGGREGGGRERMEGEGREGERKEGRGEGEG
jgi:hypothetical protein